VEHGAEFGAGVGFDAADGDDVVGVFVFCVPEVVLSANRDRWRGWNVKETADSPPNTRRASSPAEKNAGSE
jgi:hypothetical protein